MPTQRVTQPSIVDGVTFEDLRRSRATGIDPLTIAHQRCWRAVASFRRRSEAIERVRELQNEQHGPYKLELVDRVGYVVYAPR